MVGDELIIQPGGTINSLVALKCQTGEMVWKSRANQTGYAAPQLADWKGKKQIISFDLDSIGGFDAVDGKRLWKIESGKIREFHVPSPILFGDGLVTVGENFGTRRFTIDEHGIVDTHPASQQPDLASDMQSPVANSRWILGVNNELMALNLKSLEVEWRIDAPCVLEVL